MLFSNAINRDTTIIIESEALKNKLKTFEGKCILRKVPMRISEICEILHRELDEITFIEIMSNAKITKA